MSPGNEGVKSEPRPLAGLMRFSVPGQRFDLLILLLVWIIAVALSNPVGNFPLNDDWSYAITVKRLMNEGVFSPPVWSATLLVHAFWGALFSSIFGYSFTTLRFCNICSAFTGVYALYFLARQLGGSRRIALAAAFTLAFNPVFFANALSFMTDATFIALAVMALIAYAESLRSDSAGWTVSGTVFSLLAVLTRQVGVFLPMAYGVGYLVKKGLSLRTLFRASVPTAVGIAVLLLFDYWVKHNSALPTYTNMPMGVLSEWLHRPAARFLKSFLLLDRAMIYLGLFLLPVLLVTSSDSTGLAQWPPTIRLTFGYIVPAIVIVVTLASLIVTKRMMPLAQNVLAPWGIGPITGGDELSPLPAWFWAAVTLMGIIGAGWLVRRILLMAIDQFTPSFHFKQDGQSLMRCFILSAAALFLAPSVATFYIDRYLLPVVVLLALAMLIGSDSHATARSAQTACGIASIGFVVLFTVFAEHDYMAAYRAHWQILNELTARGTPPSQISGGYEFDGLYTYKQKVDPEYIMAKQLVPGYKTVRELQFSRWLPPKNETVMLLHRSGDGSAAQK